MDANRQQAADLERHHAEDKADISAARTTTPTSSSSSSNLQLAAALEDPFETSPVLQEQSDPNRLDPVPPDPQKLEPSGGTDIVTRGTAAEAAPKKENLNPFRSPAKAPEKNGRELPKRAHSASKADGHSAARGKPALDVESFKRLIMTGAAEPAAPGRSVLPSITTAGAEYAPSSVLGTIGAGAGGSGDGGSTTDASSISRQSLFDTMAVAEGQEAAENTPRTSYEISRSEEEERSDAAGGALDGRPSTAKRPPPPTHRHGRPIRSDSAAGRDLFTSQTHASSPSQSPARPPRSIATGATTTATALQTAPAILNDITNYLPSPSSSSSNINLPSPSTPSKKVELEPHNSREAARLSLPPPPPPPPPPQLSQRTAPKAPLSRRRSQAGPRSDVLRSALAEGPPKERHGADEGDSTPPASLSPFPSSPSASKPSISATLSAPAEAGQARKPPPPPPPPSRRPGVDHGPHSSSSSLSLSSSLVSGAGGEGTATSRLTQPAGLNSGAALRPLPPLARASSVSSTIRPRSLAHRGSGNFGPQSASASLSYASSLAHHTHVGLPPPPPPPPPRRRGLSRSSVDSNPNSLPPLSASSPLQAKAGTSGGPHGSSAEWRSVSDEVVSVKHYHRGDDAQPPLQPLAVQAPPSAAGASAGDSPLQQTAAGPQSASSNDALADLYALQREVDELRGKVQRRQATRSE